MYPVTKISYVYSPHRRLSFSVLLPSPLILKKILLSCCPFLSVSSSPSFQMSALSVVCLYLSSSLFWFSTSLFHSITVSINRNLVGWRCSQQQWQRMINFFSFFSNARLFFISPLSSLVQFKNECAFWDWSGN